MTNSDRFSLEGKIALCIGGTSGIGGAITLGFAEAGATVLPASRRKEKADETAAEARARGAQAQGYVVDATDMKALKNLVAQVIEDHGRIDILLNSQGITAITDAENACEEDYDAVLNTNLKSVFFSCVEVGRHMLERRSGSILNIASMSSFRGWPRSVYYGMSKFGVLSLTQTLAAEWSDRGVRVNGIAPGFFPTDLTRTAMKPERKQRALEGTPMGRFGDVEELSGTAVYLCSEAAKFVTGETICVDGGYMAKGI